jgi:hypothetical protein
MSSSFFVIEPPLMVMLYMQNTACREEGTIAGFPTAGAWQVNIPGMRIGALFIRSTNIRILQC